MLLEPSKERKKRILNCLAISHHAANLHKTLLSMSVLSPTVLGLFSLSSPEIQLWPSAYKPDSSVEFAGPAHLCKQVSDGDTLKATCPGSFTPTHTRKVFTPQSTFLSRQDVANIAGAYLAIIPQTSWPSEISPGPGSEL